MVSIRFPHADQQDISPVYPLVSAASRMRIANRIRNAEQNRIFHSASLGSMSADFVRISDPPSVSCGRIAAYAIKNKTEIKKASPKGITPPFSLVRFKSGGGSHHRRSA